MRASLLELAGVDAPVGGEKPALHPLLRIQCQRHRRVTVAAQAFEEAVQNLRPHLPLVQ